MLPDSNISQCGKVEACSAGSDGHQDGSGCNGLFSGCIFSLEHDVCSGKEKKKLVEIIQGLGGKVHYLLTKDVKFLLVKDTTNSNYASKSYKQHLAMQHNIPIIKPSFLHDCLASNTKPEDMLQKTNSQNPLKRKRRSIDIVAEEGHNARSSSLFQVGNMDNSLEQQEEEDETEEEQDEIKYEYRGNDVDYLSFTIVNDVMLVKDSVVEFEFEVAYKDNDDESHSNNNNSSDSDKKNTTTPLRIFCIKKTAFNETQTRKYYVNLRVAEVRILHILVIVSFY